MKKYLFLNTGSHDAAYNMACDDLLLEKVRADNDLVFFKVCQWAQPAFTIGYSQRIDNVLDTARCRAHGYSIVRRPTGGRMVLHAGELAYAYVVRLDSLAERRRQAEMVGSIFVGALRWLGVAATVVTTGGHTPSVRFGPATCCASLSEHEIMVGVKKIMGRAFRDKSGYRLEQGFLLLDSNRPDVREYLPKPDPDTAAQSITVEAAAGKKVAFEHLVTLLYKEACLSTGQIWQQAVLTPEDEERIGQLVQEKYGNAEWLNKF